MQAHLLDPRHCTSLSSPYTLLTFPAPYTQPKSCTLLLQHFPLFPHPRPYTHILTCNRLPQPPQHSYQGTPTNPEMSQDNTATAASHPLMHICHPERGLAATCPSQIQNTTAPAAGPTVPSRPPVDTHLNTLHAVAREKEAAASSPHTSDPLPQSSVSPKSTAPTPHLYHHVRPTAPQLTSCTLQGPCTLVLPHTFPPYPPSLLCCSPSSSPAGVPHSSHHCPTA